MTDFSKDAKIFKALCDEKRLTNMYIDKTLQTNYHILHQNNLI